MEQTLGGQAMCPSIVLPQADRRQLLTIYRKGPPNLRLRAHILLLLADGQTWASICAFLFCSSATIGHWKNRYAQGGLPAVLQDRRGRTPDQRETWLVWIVHWILECCPQDFGFLRSRWCCRLVVVVLLQTQQVEVSAETVRRWLHQADLVWRRPRPVLKPTDPDYDRKIQRLRDLLAHLPQDQTAVFQDEVDIHTNPKIGSMWMLRGQQAEVLTPGINHKCYIAGSMHWRTGRLIASDGPSRNSVLFIEHLQTLLSRLRRYHTIHVICDNAPWHTSKAVRQFLAEHPRIVLHFLPYYSPQANPIERVWWHLHEDITRNHRCGSLDELLDRVFTWLNDQSPFAIEDTVYLLKNAA